MSARPISAAFDRAARIFTHNDTDLKDTALLSLDERTDWMRGGAVLANMRMMPVTADLAASSAPFGYWRGIHPLKRTDLELALLTRGCQLRSARHRYEVSLIGIGRARTVHRVVRRLIARATDENEKAMEIASLVVRKRYGLTLAHVIAEPLQVQSTIREVNGSRRRA
jgi:hypothetical protein